MTTMDEDETAATSVAAKGFPDPQLGAPLLLAFSPPTSSAAVRKTVLVIGQQRLAAVRTFACLEAGLRVVLGVHNDARQLDAELQARLEARQVSSIEIPSNDYAWQDWLASIPPVIQNDISLVCVTDTLPSSIPASAQRSYDSAACIRHACFAARLPVNVADYPELSDFRFPATYRFPLLSDSATSATSGHSPYKASPLQIAITTNATSCRLASRLRREIVAKLPRGIGNAVEKIGRLREMAKEVDAASSTLSRERLDDGEREEGWSSTMLNKPVPQLSMPSRAKCTSPNRTKSIFHNVLPPSHIPPTPPATPPADSIGNKMEEMLSQSPSASDFKLSSRTRMRFIAQLSEYWPLERLSNLSEEEAARVISVFARSATNGPAEGDAPSTMASAGATPNSIALQGSAVRDLYTGYSQNATAPSSSSRHSLDLSVIDAIPAKRGKIFLLGSGPGSPALLTMAAHRLLTQSATLILSDKLVPQEILALIPKHIPLTIAKKFPGNAEGAQNELMDLAYDGALRGEVVVRLKQGDPYVYGRGGEEVLFFRERGFEAVVVPGISSAFAGPLMAGIPVTQRGVSESVVVCTGVGRKGKGVRLPGYERSRTTIILMGVARLQGVVNALTSEQGQEEHGREGGARDGPAYPPYCPIAIIEKASSPDQRMVASTLEGIVNAMEQAGEQRPPGMMIIGWSALALEGSGDVQVLDGVEGLAHEDVERADRKRIKRWLGDKGWLMREGLDANWLETLEQQQVQITSVD